MENITAITKGNIAKTAEQINIIILRIDNLTDNLSKFHAFVLQQGSVAGLDVHLVNIQTTLIEARQLFEEQRGLYEKLSEQIELKEPFELGPSKGVAKAQKTLEEIRRNGYEILAKKSKLNQHTMILKSMITIFQSQKTIPKTIEQMLKDIEAELKSLNKSVLWGC